MRPCAATAHHAFQRAVNHFHHHSFVNERTRIELQVAVHETANAFYFDSGMAAMLPVERHDVHDSRALENRQALFESNRAKQ